MGVHIHGGTMSGALTPICNQCNISLCWDISEKEYDEQQQFWDDWICRECNDGTALSLHQWKNRSQERGR
jgi:hypothetical protein